MGGAWETEGILTPIEDVSSLLLTGIDLNGKQCSGHSKAALIVFIDAKYHLRTMTGMDYCAEYQAVTRADYCYEC